MKFLDRAADRGQPWEPRGRRFVAKVIAEDGWMVADLGDQLLDLLTGGDGVDGGPVVAAHAGIGDDGLQAGGVAVVERRRRHETSNGDAALAHLLEHSQVVGRIVPGQHGEKVGRLLSLGGLSAGDQCCHEDQNRFCCAHGGRSVNCEVPTELT